MATITLSLPDSLKTYLDQQVRVSGCGSASDYVCKLIRRDQDRNHLRHLLQDGAKSDLTGAADADYFISLRSHIHQRQSPEGQ